jgi:hypothetical protein
MKRTIATVAVIAAATVTIAGCNDKKDQLAPVNEPTIAAPDVRGYVLPDAERILRQHSYGYSETAPDALFGIIIKSHFIVCDEDVINARMVRLTVSKDGCQE